MPAAMTAFPAARHSSLLEIACELFLVELRVVRSEILHFATEAGFEIGSRT